MNFKEGQYLLFNKTVAKITRIYYYKYDYIVKMRKFSKGNTKLGYEYQHKCTLQHLLKLYRQKKVKVIRYQEVLQCLFANYEGCMPIRNVREV